MSYYDGFFDALEKEKEKKKKKNTSQNTQAKKTQNTSTTSKRDDYTEGFYSALEKEKAKKEDIAPVRTTDSERKYGGGGRKVEDMIAPEKPNYRIASIDENGVPRWERTNIPVNKDPSFKDLTVNSFMRGRYNSRLGQETFKEMTGLKNNKEYYADKLNDEKYSFEADEWYKQMLSGASEQLGQWYTSITDPKTLAGATAAAGTVAVAGQTGPQVLAPEEIITVPSAFLGGIAVGTATNTFEIETGLAYNEMLEQGVSPETATFLATGTGVVNSALEMFQLDELAKSYKILNKTGATKGTAKKVLDYLTKRGINVATETTQEVLQEGATITATNIGSKIDKGEWAYTGKEVGSRLLDTAKQSALTFTGLGVGGDTVNIGANKVATQIAEANEKKFTETEKNVIDKVYNDAVAEEEKGGKKLTSKEKNKIYDNVVESVQNGSLGIEVIEEALGGERYEAYKKATDENVALKNERDELNKIKTMELTGEQSDRLAELKRMNLDDTTNLDELGKKWKDDVYNRLSSDRKGQGSLLLESYRERARRGQAFTADLSQYEGKKREAVERAIKSGVLNNTNRSHELVDILSNIEADKGIIFDYTDNKKLKESGFAIGGKTINGYVKDGAITLNMQSSKAWESTVGHEITHVLEGTKVYSELQTSLFEYAKSKGEFDTRKADIMKLYEKVENADIDGELTAELISDYLFNDKSFINHLTGNRTVFQKVWDEVKYLYKVATGKEKASIEKVMKEFDRAWKEMGENAAKSEGVKYSLSSISNTFFGDEGMSSMAFEKGNYKQTEGYKNYVDQCVNNMRQTRADFDEVVARGEIEEQIDGIVRVALASKKAGYDIYDDATKRSKTDSKNRLLFSSLEPNSDYFTSSYISTICDKRKNFAEIYDEIVRTEEAKGVPQGKRFFDNVDNYFALHKIMADKGLTQPCRQCYVESMRKNLAPMANAFLKLVNETDANNKANDQLYEQKGKNKGNLKSNNAELREKVLETFAEHPEYGMSASDLTVETLTTEDGLAQLKIQAPLIYEAFNSFYGQSKPKMPKEATPFRFGELTALLTDHNGKIKQSLVDKINSTGGFRLQSYSDFQIQNFTDVLQVIFEAGTLGLNGHAYTKVPAFLDATEGTNLKRNISIFMYKDRNEWKLDKNDSFPYDLEEIYEIVKADKSGNTSIIAVSQNKDMSCWIMANDLVGYGIPFHKSGLKMGTVRDTDVKTDDGRIVKGYSGTIDHTKQQTEVWARATAEHKALTKVKKGINIYSFWDFENKANLSKNELIEKNVKAYIDACEEAGYLPKFRDYVMNNGTVLNDVLKYSKELGFASQDATIDDISFKYKGYTIPYGYYKFLGDFGMFAPDGTASPQETLSLSNYDFDKAENFFADAEALNRNEILQQFSNGEEREKYRNSNLSAEELAEIVNRKRKEVAESVVAPVKNSLSNNGEQPSTKGTPLRDLYLEQDIAPIREDVAKNATATSEAPIDAVKETTEENSVAENVAPVDESMPFAESDEDIIKTVTQRLNARITNSTKQLEEMEMLRDWVKASYEHKIEKLQNQYNSKKNKETKVAYGIQRRIANLKRVAADIDADIQKRISDIGTRISKTTERMENPTEKDILEIRYEKINKQLEADKASLAEDFERRKQEIEKTIIYRPSYVSNRAFELYRELQGLKKGVRASKDLSYLLDNLDLSEAKKAESYNELRKALNYIKNQPVQMKPSYSKIESVARDLLSRAYDENVSALDDLENQFRQEVEKLERDAEEQRKKARTANQKRIMMEEHAKFAEDLLGDTSTWVDKKLGLQYAVNTERRNLRDIVRDENGNVDIKKADAINDALNGQYNRDEAEKQRELAKIRKKYADLKITRAEDTYAQMLGEFRHNPKTTLTQEAIDEYYEENKNKIDVAKVEKVIEYARKDYDDLIVRLNEVLREQGMKEIPYRKGYFPHFTEPKQNFFQKLINWKVQDNEIPTSIAGLTEDFKPTKSWQSFDKTRYSDETDYSFTKGFDKYSEGALDWIYHIDTLQKRRAVENHIRFTHSDEGIQARIKEVYADENMDADEAQAQIDHILAEAENPLNNFVQDFMTHTNILANKKNSLDRTAEQMTNRKIYNVMQNVQNRTSANMVLANIRSALTNFIPITQSWAQVSPLRSLQATKDVIANAIKDDGMVDKSTFLTNRLREADKLYQSNWDKVLDKAGIMFEVIDNISSQVIWRSKYNQNIANHMTEEQAIANADQFAENVMAGRSKGNEPTIFNAKNPLVKAFTMFQLEVNNQYGYLFKDVPNDLKAETNHWKFNLAKGYTTAFIGAYVYNALLSKVTGSDAAFDPIGIIEDLMRDLGLFDDDEEKEPDEVITNFADNVIEELPFVGGIFGGGRIPISSAMPYGGEYGGGLSGAVKDVTEGNWKNIGKEMMKPLLNVGLPVGGGQIKKTVQGLGMFNTDEEHPVMGSYTDSGKLRFPVEDTPLNRIQAGLFGQYANENAREYFDNGYDALNKKQIQEYQDVDLPIADYWKYREGLKGLKKNEEKADFINSLDIEDWQKNILMNNILDRKEDVDMTNYDDYADYEEFDWSQKNPEKYDFFKTNGISYSDYANADEDGKDAYNWAYNNPEKFVLSKAVTDDVITYRSYTDALFDIKADKDASGKTISGSAKAKKRNYIFNLDGLDYGQKAILYRSLYDSKDDKAEFDEDIVYYINSRNDLTDEEKVTIYTELGFTVKDGYVYW